MTLDQILALEPALVEFLGEFDACFGQSEPRQHLKQYSSLTVSRPLKRERFGANQHATVRSLRR
jgi:hypothetical protein